MKQIIGIILIVFALIIGYDGIRKLENSGGSVKVLGIELSAEDKGAKQTAYLEIGVGILVLLGGIYLMRTSKN